jgi:hypothetical protein
MGIALDGASPLPPVLKHQRLPRRSRTRLDQFNKQCPLGSEADMCGAKRDLRFTPYSDRESRHAANGHVCFTPESGHMRCTSRCLLRAKSGHHDHLSAESSGASEAEGIILGVRSESGTLNLQTSPVEAKAASTFPPNCSSARKNSRVPKPR